MSNDAFAFSSIAELAQALQSREVSPVDLTRRSIERLESIGAELNAVVAITAERAMREAQFAEDEIRAGRARHPLHGVPYGAKDLLATAGDPTTWGAAPLRDQITSFDATVVKRLRDAGAIMVGKLAMSELAGGLDVDRAEATYTGPARNPWNIDAYCGGSTSGGSGAVAAGCIPYTIGSETWGSILAPAAFTGLTGLRPTYGLVSRYGAMALSWTLDKIGPLCRDAIDCGLVLDAIAGADANDPATVSREIPSLTELHPQSNYRLGIVRSDLESAQPEVRQNFEEAVRLLGDVATVEDVSLPDQPYSAVCWTIMVAEGASAFEELIDSGQVADLIAPEDRIGGFVAEAISAKSYIKALRIRRRIRQQLTALVSKYDAVLAPTTKAVAPPLGRQFSDYYGQAGGQSVLIAAGNVAGLPAITVPTGFGERGLPTGMQFMGAPFSEALLLELAATYQSMTDWHQRSPVLPV